MVFPSSIRNAGGMKLLVLGGTEFLGSALVSEALAKGWDVTTLNRGTTPAAPGVRSIVGDRRDGLAIEGEWDVVADTSSQEPSIVRDSAHHLSGRAARYVYVSSRSVHSHPTAQGADESAPLVVNRPGETTMGKLLELALEVTGSSGALRWADPAWLLAEGVEPWMQLPVWIPEGQDHETMHEADVSAAFAAGLRIRPLRETVADTWEWLRGVGGKAPTRPGVGLDPERERQLITALIPI